MSCYAGEPLELDATCELAPADGMDPACLAEGGYIEAVYPGGQHLVFVRPRVTNSSSRPSTTSSS